MRPSALALLCALSACLSAPTVVLAQSPFGGGSLPAQPAEEPQAPSPPKDEGLSSGQTILILFGGAVLLGGIAWAIMRDARARAGDEDEGHEERRERARAEKEAERHRRKAAARRKGKAAKQARRSNRPR